MNKLILLIGVIVSLVGCNKSKPAANEIRVGTIAGPETTLMEVAKIVAKEQSDLNVKIITFNDYVLPNQALNDGSIDANMFQHQPYLDATIKAKGYELVSIGKTFIYPMGLYSEKISNLNDLKTGDVVAIPNDPSNEARALLLLNDAGIIQLKKTAGVIAGLSDILENPLKLVFKEMDASQLPRVLPDVTLAAINTNYAMIAGLVPTRDAILLESADSPYANIVVVRSEDKDLPKFKQLMEALHSQAVMDKAEELFKAQAIAAWK